MLIRTAMLRPILLDLFCSHPGYQVSPSTYADQVAQIYGEEVKKRSRPWNEIVLEKIATSSPTRAQEVK
jgi:hypothetical protein